MSVRAKKHLGQHFLKDEGIAQNIADALTLKGYENVLEIGPGMGVLTKYILKKDVKTHVIEIDRDSVAYLKTAIEVQKLDFKIIEGDFLKINIKDYFQDTPIAIIGNFPYNISTQILFKTIENRDQIPEFSGMFQKEVAKRIAEKEGSKVYGILSVLTQAFYDVEYLFTVGPENFSPPPKVQSAVIRLTRKKNFKNLGCDEKRLKAVVKASFGMRRKMLRNSMKQFLPKNVIFVDEFFQKRPENLTVEEFVYLTNLTFKHSPS